MRRAATWPLLTPTIASDASLDSDCTAAARRTEDVDRMRAHHAQTCRRTAFARHAEADHRTWSTPRVKLLRGSPMTGERDTILSLYRYFTGGSSVSKYFVLRLLVPTVVMLGLALSASAGYLGSVP